MVQWAFRVCQKRPFCQTKDGRCTSFLEHETRCHSGPIKFAWLVQQPSFVFVTCFFFNDMERSEDIPPFHLWSPCSLVPFSLWKDIGPPAFHMLYYMQFYLYPVVLAGGCPVIRGNKWSSTKWMHIHEYKAWGLESRTCKRYMLLDWVCKVLLVLFLTCI